MPTVPKFMIHFNLLFVVAQGPTNRHVRGPTDPNRSEIIKILLVLVRSCPRFWNFSGSCSGPIPAFEIIFLVRSGPRFQFFFGPVWSKIKNFMSILVRFDLRSRSRVWILDPNWSRDARTIHNGANCLETNSSNLRSEYLKVDTVVLYLLD